MRVGIDDTKYVFSLQDALIEMDLFGKITAPTIKRIQKEHNELKKVLEKEGGLLNG